MGDFRRTGNLYAFSSANISLHLHFLQAAATRMIGYKIILKMPYCKIRGNI